MIAVPSAYLDHVRHVQEKIEETKSRLVTLLSEHSPDAMQADASAHDDDEEEKRELTEKILTSSAISKRFLVNMTFYSALYTQMKFYFFFFNDLFLLSSIYRNG